MKTLLGSIKCLVPGFPAVRLRNWLAVWSELLFPCLDFPFDTFMVSVDPFVWKVGVEMEFPRKE